MGDEEVDANKKQKRKKLAEGFIIERSASWTDWRKKKEAEFCRSPSNT